MVDYERASGRIVCRDAALQCSSNRSTFHVTVYWLSLGLRNSRNSFVPTLAPRHRVFVPLVPGHNLSFNRRWNLPLPSSTDAEFSSSSEYESSLHERR